MLSSVRLRSQRIIAGLVLVSVAGACSEDDSYLTSYIQPTEVAVRPSDFLGDVSCSTNPGAMRSYVVTLTAYDDADDVTGFTLGSSVATPCSFVVGFREVVTVGKRYTAEVDGYDLPPEQLVPFGGASSGARQMRDSSTGEVLTPRWTTRCGQTADGAATAALNELVYVRPCDALDDLAPSATAIALSPGHVLGDDPCAVAATIDIEEELVGLPAVPAVACDAEPVVFDAVAGELYSFYVSAMGLDNRLRGTQCFAMGVTGETVVPSCGTLTDQGSMRLSVAGLQVDGADEDLCPPEAYFDVLYQDEALNAVPLSCAAQAHVSPLEPATYLLDVTIYGDDGQLLGDGASCSAAVVPGKTVDGFCLAN